MANTLRLTWASPLVLALLLAGCGGSPSYQSSMQSTLAGLGKTVQAYNQSQQTSLSAEAAACRQARVSLEVVKAEFQKMAPAHYRREVAALRQAYRQAHSGFLDCSRAASSLNYLLMTQAESEVALANASLARARQLDQ